jgi:hypothetical protein
MAKRALVFGLVGACLAASSAVAGDILWDVLPLFNTRPSLSSKVIVSDACWRTCVAECGSVLHVCARRHALAECRAQGDACDLGCQKTCRTYGGPLLDITNSD